MKKNTQEINYFYLALVSMVSFFWFILKEKTAYDWPAIDMIPIYERFFDSKYLLNDFFTNASTNEFNPRWFFGYFIIGLSLIFNAKWYTIVYVTKLLLVVIMPILYYLVVFAILSRYIDKNKLRYAQVLIFLAITLIIYPRFSGIFSIAWWIPLMIQAAPQSLSMFSGLFAIVYKEFDFKLSSLFSGLFFALSVLIHPAIGLFVLSFYILTLLKDIQFEWKYVLFYLFISFFTIFLIQIFDSHSISLNAIEFIKIYCIENNSSHYHLRDFGTLTPFKWWVSLIIVLNFMIIPLIYFIVKKNRNLIVISTLFLLSYMISIVLQYVFIDLIPSKIIAELGPVRFTQFGYWMIVILWTAMLCEFKILQKININFRNSKKIIPILLIFLVIWGGYLMDFPFKTKYNKNKKMYDFINTTKQDSVFGVYFSNLKLDIPYIANRAVFIGNGFPFNEDYFAEYQNRKRLLYGAKSDLDKISGAWEGEKMAKYFRMISPMEFYKISTIYKLDYVLIENAYSSKFADYKSVYKNEKISIYKVLDFKGGN